MELIHCCEAEHFLDYYTEEEQISYLTVNLQPLLLNYPITQFGYLRGERFCLAFCVSEANRTSGIWFRRLPETSIQRSKLTLSREGILFGDYFVFLESQAYKISEELGTNVAIDRCESTATFALWLQLNILGFAICGKSQNKPLGYIMNHLWHRIWSDAVLWPGIRKREEPVSVDE